MGKGEWRQAFGRRRLVGLGIVGLAGIVFGWVLLAYISNSPTASGATAEIVVDERGVRPETATVFVGEKITLAVELGDRASNTWVQVVGSAKTLTIPPAGKDCDDTLQMTAADGWQGMTRVVKLTPPDYRTRPTMTLCGIQAGATSLSINISGAHTKRFTSKVNVVARRADAPISLSIERKADDSTSTNGAGWVAEGSTARFTVTSDPAPELDQTLKWEIVPEGNVYGGGETSASHFVGSLTGTITIPQDQQTAEIAVQTKADTTYDPGKGFTVVLKDLPAHINKTQTELSTPLVQIQNDDPGALVQGSCTQVAEGKAITCTLTLDEPLDGLSGDVRVNYHTVDGTAVAGSDYTNTSGHVTLTATGTKGKSTDSETISISTIDDSTAETDETLSIALSLPSNASSSHFLVATSLPTTIFDSGADLNYTGPEVTIGVKDYRGPWIMVEGDTLDVEVYFDKDPTTPAPVTITSNQPFLTVLTPRLNINSSNWKQTHDLLNPGPTFRLQAKSPYAYQDSNGNDYLEATVTLTLIRNNTPITKTIKFVVHDNQEKKFLFHPSTVEVEDGGPWRRLWVRTTRPLGLHEPKLTIDPHGVHGILEGRIEHRAFTPWDDWFLLSIRAPENTLSHGSSYTLRFPTPGFSGELPITVVANKTKLALVFDGKLRTDPLFEGTEYASETFKVRLNQNPNGRISAAFSSSLDGAFTFSPPRLDFSSSNWDSWHSVTVTAHKGNYGSGVMSGNGRLLVSWEKPPIGATSFNDFVKPNFELRRFNHDLGFLYKRTATVSHSELNIPYGATRKFYIRSSNGCRAHIENGVCPAHSRDIHITSADPTRIIVHGQGSARAGLPSGYTYLIDSFDKKWHEIQTVYVTAIGNPDDGDATANLNFSTLLATPATPPQDPNFFWGDTDLLFQQHFLPVNLKQHGPALRLSAPGYPHAYKDINYDYSLVVNEGESATYTVHLGSSPTGNGDVTVTPYKLGSQITITPSKLYFNASNWDVPQSVTVSASSDSTIESNKIRIYHKVENYPGFSIDEYAWGGQAGHPSVSVFIYDGFSVSSSDIGVTEGNTASYQIKLHHDPGAGKVVNVKIENSDPDSVMLSHSQVTFTGGSSGNWKSPQTVTVSGLYDADSMLNTVRLRHYLSGFAAGPTWGPGYDLINMANGLGNPGLNSFRYKWACHYARGFATYGCNHEVEVFVRAAETPSQLDRPAVVISHAAEGTKPSLFDHEHSHKETAYWIRLNSDPGAGNTVRVDITNPDPGAITVSPPFVTFNTHNWRTPQAIDVREALDPDWTDETVTLTHTVTGYPTVTTAPNVVVQITDGLIVLPGRVTIQEGSKGKYGLNAWSNFQPIINDSITLGNVTIANPDTGAVIVRHDGGGRQLTSFRIGTWKDDHPEFEPTRRLQVESVQDQDSDDEEVTITFTTQSPYGPKTFDLVVEVVDDEGLTGSTGSQGPAITVAASSSSVTEADTAEFTFTATPAPTSDLTVSFLVLTNNDYTQPGQMIRSVTIPTSGTAQFALQLDDDEVDEEHDGTIAVMLRDGPGYVLGSAVVARVSVTDNDDGTTDGTTELETSDGGGACTTASGWAWWSWLRSKQTQATAPQAVRDLAARAVKTLEGADTLTWAAWIAKEPGWGTLNDNDSRHDNRRAVRDELNRLEACRDGGGGTVTPATPVVSVTGGQAVTEGGAAGFTVSASPAPAAALTVNIAVSQTGDYAASGTTGTKTVTIPTTGSATYTVSTVDDGADEANGSVTVTISTGSGYTVHATHGAATVTVRDNDEPPQQATQEGEDGGGAETPAAFVSNLGQADENTPGFVHDYAQGFRTGGHSGGYTLTAVDVQFASVATPFAVTATIRTASSGNPSATVVGTLTSPAFSDLSTDSSLSFTSDGIDLDASTDYFLVLDVASDMRGTRLRRTAATADDAGAAAGWSIADDRRSRPFAGGDSDWSSRPNPFKIELRGTAREAPATPVVSITAGSGVTEGGTATFTLTASPAPASALTVNIAVAQTGDYAASGTTGTKTVTIPASGTASYTVATLDDSADETDGSITVTANTGSGYTVHATNGAATVSVADNDVPAISITAGSAVTEGGTATFTLTASPAPASALTVTVAVTQSGDYAASGATGTKTVVIGTSGTASYTVATVNDTADEADGSITVTVNTGTGYTVATTSAATVAVADDDVPAVTVTAGPAVTEGGTATFTLTAAPAPAAALTVNIAVAQAGDYAASGTTGAKTVVIPTSGTASYTVATADDTADEADGSITVTVNTGTGYTVAATPSATVSVADDDQPATGPGITASATALTVAQNAQQTFTVALNQAPTATVYLTATSFDSSVALVSTPDGRHPIYNNPFPTTSLTFNAADWSTPKTIRIHGQNPGTAQILITISTTDPAYREITIPTITATTQ